jgi:hypothetical protein
VDGPSGAHEYPGHVRKIRYIQRVTICPFACLSDLNVGLVLTATEKPMSLGHLLGFRHPQDLGLLRPGFPVGIGAP